MTGHRGTIRASARQRISIIEGVAEYTPPAPDEPGLIVQWDEHTITIEPERDHPNYRSGCFNAPGDRWICT